MFSLGNIWCITLPWARTTKIMLLFSLNPTNPLLLDRPWHRTKFLLYFFFLRCLFYFIPFCFLLCFLLMVGIRWLWTSPQWTKPSVIFGNRIPSFSATEDPTWAHGFSLAPEACRLWKFLRLWLLRRCKRFPRRWVAAAALPCRRTLLERWMLMPRVPGIHADAKGTCAFNQGWFLAQSILQKMSGHTLRWFC